MPVDAAAYMAGEIPGLSLGGSMSWASHPGSGSRALTPKSPVGDVGQTSTYTDLQRQTLVGFYQNPLLLGRMAAFGSAGPLPTPRARASSASHASVRPPCSHKTLHGHRFPEASHHRGESAVTYSHGSRYGSQPGSPLRCGEWSGGSGGRVGPESPEVEGSVRQRSVSSVLDDGKVTSRYGPRCNTQGGPATGTASSTALCPPLRGLPREEEGRQHRSQPKIAVPVSLTGPSGDRISPAGARFRRSPLSGISNEVQEAHLPSPSQPTNNFSLSRKTARFSTRPTVGRRHTEQSQTPGFVRPALTRRSISDKLGPSLRPSPHRRPENCRSHTEQVETPPAPPPAPSPRVRVATSPCSAFDLHGMLDDLSASDTRQIQKYSYPACYEGYDRYPTNGAVYNKHQQEVTTENEGGISPAAYLPLDYVGPPVKGVRHGDGASLETKRVPRMRGVAVLPPTPVEPRWVQARPPRAAMVQGGWGPVGQ